MDNNKIVSKKSYYNLLQLITSLLNLSLPEIRQKIADYPYCLIDYFEKGVEERSIEIRFAMDELTATCLFSNEDKCESVDSLARITHFAMLPSYFFFAYICFYILGVID